MPSADAVRQPPRSGGTYCVTLITGDKVTIGTAVGGTAIRSFESPNGTTTGFRRPVVDGSMYVYPDAALPCVSAGKLDEQLFNVMQLIADGYGDAHAERLAALPTGWSGASPPVPGWMSARCPS
ncbi:hypothetical protein [Streptomyces sp. NPDC057909]|uniref:hypothetical protein n=1 Tax=Streptomyces sp. NPDC057909 TaxID=3346277 RepID=UPI0036E331C5